jgi:hypothetical protein
MLMFLIAAGYSDQQTDSQSPGPLDKHLPVVFDELISRRFRTIGAVIPVCNNESAARILSTVAIYPSLTPDAERLASS